MERKRIISAAEAVEMYREEERRRKAAEELGKIVGKFIGRVIGIAIDCVIIYALWKTFGC